MKKNNILLIVLTIISGILFIYSAYSKIFPIELLENNLVDTGLFNWTLAPLASRLLIASEFLVGVLLILQVRLKKFTLPISILLLIVFNIYLIALLIKYGNTGSCGCFGTKLSMTPIEGIIKNVFLILVFVGLYFIKEKEFKKDWIYQSFLFASIISAIILPFILNPLSFSKKAFIVSTKHQKLHLDTIYTLDIKMQPIDSTRFLNKHIIAYLSMECEHCKITAQKLSLFKEKHPEFPVFFVLNGNKKMFEKFKIDTKFKNIEYGIINNYYFLKDTRGSFPKVYLSNNLNIVGESEKYYLLNEEEIETWLKSK